jgi:iron complex outermembrane receptor protein
MHRFLILALCCLAGLTAHTQIVEPSIKLRIQSGPQPISDATVELIQIKDSALIKVQVSNQEGEVGFDKIPPGPYSVRVSKTGYTALELPVVSPMKEIKEVNLTPGNRSMETVTITARKPFVEMRADKTIINLDAGASNIGTTALEALEKMPGITVDRNGMISLKGKPNVLILIDGKQTYLGAAELSSLLNGMNASEISQVELMDQPPARFEASGNGGVINIRTKKNRQKGFNGSVNLAYGQGVYPKTNHSLQLNQRSGKLNVFLNYSFNHNLNFTKIYALRSYFEQDGQTIAAMLEQPSYIRYKQTAHNLRTGFDYFISSRTTIGLVVNGTHLDRSSNGNNSAYWMKADLRVDSVLVTQSRNSSHWKNGGINFNFRHAATAEKELTMDLDILGYRIRTNQFFENHLAQPPGYTEASRGNIPSLIRILSAKADYKAPINKKIKTEAGWKSSRINTDNKAAYEYLDGLTWKEDQGKTNHFLYTENIHALYGSGQISQDRWTLQGGLRYEHTRYQAEQLGNAVRNDSSFSRSYNSLFPSAYISFKADSLHSLTVSGGRRIDRPPFQKLNPFLFIINKYTYQQGNPFYRPQYTWNVQISHLYKDLLLTSVSYSQTKDYFSQIFTADSLGLIIYTEGNVGRVQQFGASLGLTLAPAPWCNLSLQASGSHKRFMGQLWRNYRANISQVNFNLNSQFRWGKGWSSELSGFYNTRSQNDLQEVLDPSGQLSIGLSKSIFKNKGSLRFAVRDIFYTQVMQGDTYFQYAHEFFSLLRDSRMATIAFTYRFGTTMKATKRSSGAAGEEVQRVGSGN